MRTAILTAAIIVFLLSAWLALALAGLFLDALSTAVADWIGDQMGWTGRYVAAALIISPPAAFIALWDQR